MKIELRLENGKPIIFLLSEVENNHAINCWTDAESHSSATRAYMRSLPKPTSQGDILACWQTLARYSEHVVYTMKL